jgi:hypothetical protein
MATIHPPQVAAPREQTRFFFVMALVMALVIVGGFTLQLAMGRSSFAVPAAYHLHAAVFMGWIGIYLAQHVTALRGQWALHAGFGRIAYLWIPLMLVFGSVLMVVVARRTGGPFFFHVSEFLWSNMMLLWCFGGLAFWALRRRRYRLAQAIDAVRHGDPDWTRSRPDPAPAADDPACMDDHHAGYDGVSRNRHDRRQARDGTRAPRLSVGPRHLRRRVRPVAGAGPFGDGDGDYPQRDRGHAGRTASDGGVSATRLHNVGTPSPSGPFGL